jgi:hypothetical protein
MSTGGNARLFQRVVVLTALLAASLAAAQSAEAATCGTSNGHTLCITVPDEPLTGPTFVKVTNVANKGTLITVWIPAGASSPINLITKFKPSPETGDYSFVWPTQKYLDASGVLRVQQGSTGSTPVEVSVTLSNGNATDFQHTPSDWADYLPGPWTAPTDPVIAAAGDGAADESGPNANAASIVAANPALFLYLGDVYERGTFTENLNHYGVSALDGTSGTLWGTLARITQPTVGNHEASHRVDWMDYWHGHPDFTSFRFGGVLFLDLNSSKSLAVGSKQYKFVQNALATAPPCIAAFWHIPVKTGTTTSRFQMWQLLANNGGDLLVEAHAHSMAEYKPLDANLQLGGHMVQLISGSGGHSLGSGFSDPEGRLQWTLTKVTGALYLTLFGAASLGTATGIGWSFQDVNHTVLETGSVTC